MLVRVRADKDNESGYINCMRGSWLENPFPVNRYGREGSLSLYQMYIDWRMVYDHVFHEYVRKLYFKSKSEIVSLGCTCKLEERCHVDILIETINLVFKSDKFSSVT